MFSPELIHAFQNRATPFYYYDLELLRETVHTVRRESSKYNFHVHYALKANADARFLELMRSEELGADCVSGNEVKRAIECGFESNVIVFAGVGKSDAEINYALDHDISCFNCESTEELEVINALAAAKSRTASVALRINPNVNANTHKYITTGLEENKFGINVWELEQVLAQLRQLKHVRLAGLHFHIGSQITDLDVFRQLCLRMNEIRQWFENNKIVIENINVGGGLGVDYHEPDTHRIADFAAYFRLFHDFLETRPGQQVHFELGRSIVAQCGALISRVLYIKKGLNTNFAILDAGMTELMRPALYQAYHRIENISKTAATVPQLKYDVVGPICESSDCFGKAVHLPETQRGDLIAIRTTGAYGEVMSSAYNLREKAGVLYSDELMDAR